MPRYEDNGRDRRRRSDASRSPDRHHHSSSRSKRYDAEPRERKRRRSMISSVSPDRESLPRSGRGHESRRHRSRSRDSRRRHRSSSRSQKHDHRRDKNRETVPDRNGLPSSRSRVSRSRSPRPLVRSKQPLPSQRDAFSKTPGRASESSTPAQEKEKPNFANSGMLAAETNTVTAPDGSTSIVLKYHEPPEARKPPPKDAWRLYIFKGDDLLDTVELGGRSCWLIGKERLVADLPVDHPSCSKQHAALQFRYVEKRNEFGDRDGRVRPYLIDLESSNGTMVNGDAIPPSRYVELMDKDVLKFGLSTREYVLMLPPPD